MLNRLVMNILKYIENSNADIINFLLFLSIKLEDKLDARNCD